MKGILELKSMRFHAYHGCFDFEKQNGGEYLVDFKAELDITKAMESDRLEDSVDYGGIYNVVKEQMQISSNLIEHVAGRIANAIKETFPQIEHFSITVHKLNPPVEGVTDESSISISI